MKNARVEVVRNTKSVADETNTTVLNETPLYWYLLGFFDSFSEKMNVSKENALK